MPAPTGSGGGLFGSIRCNFINDPRTFALFGDRIYPGIAPPGTPFPFLILSHVSGSVEEFSYVLDINIWNLVFQASVYAEGYEPTRTAGIVANIRISRNIFVYEHIGVWVYPQSFNLTIDPRRSESGADVWHAAYRYNAAVPEILVPGLLE